MKFGDNPLLIIVCLYHMSKMGCIGSINQQFYSYDPKIMEWNILNWVLKYPLGRCVNYMLTKMSEIKLYFLFKYIFLIVLI